MWRATILSTRKYANIEIQIELLPEIAINVDEEYIHCGEIQYQYPEANLT